MYQQDLQFPPGHCPVPGGPCPGPGGPCPGSSPGVVLGDFFPETDNRSHQPRSHVIKSTPRSRPRSCRRSETDARYGWGPLPYQTQGRPSTGGNPQSMMMPPRGAHGNQRQRAMDVPSNTMLTWQDRPGPPPLPPPPPPPTRPPPYPSAERPYEYSQPPPNMAGAGESFLHGHMTQQTLPPPPPAPPQYQNMPPMQPGAASYDYHGSGTPDCTWRQMPVCHHTSSRPPFAPPQYSTPPQQPPPPPPPAPPPPQQQTRQYYQQHNAAPRTNVQYVPAQQQQQYQPQTQQQNHQYEAPPGTWAPPPPRYSGQQQQQVMTLPPMTTPPPGHYYVTERPPSSQPPPPLMYDVPEKDNANAYYGVPQQQHQQRNSVHTPSQQQQTSRLYGQQQSAAPRYGQAGGNGGTPVKPAQRGQQQHPSKQYQAYNPQSMTQHHDLSGHVSTTTTTQQNHQGRQFAPFAASSEQIVTNEASGNVQQYPYFYRYSETVKTSQPLSEHACDGGQRVANAHQCGGDHSSSHHHQTKSQTIISSKSVSEVQMLVGVSGGEYRIPTQHVETATTKLALRPSVNITSNKHHTTSTAKHGGHCQTKKHSVRNNEMCRLSRDKIARVSKRSDARAADNGCSLKPSSRVSCKRRLSDSSEVSALMIVDRGRAHAQRDCSVPPRGGEPRPPREIDDEPVPRLDLAKLNAACDEDEESDFEEAVSESRAYECRAQNVAAPVIAAAATSDGACTFLDAISKESKSKLPPRSSREDDDGNKYDPFDPGSATSFEYSIDAERLVARLCYSSPETSPPSSAQRRQPSGFDAAAAAAQGISDAHNGCLLANMYTSHERSCGNNEQHVTSSETYTNDLALLDLSSMMAGECDAHVNPGIGGDASGSHNVIALNDCVAGGNDVAWNEGILLISKGLALLKSCKSKDPELNKRFELMLYELERISRRGIVPESHNSFLRLEEVSSQQHQYSSRLSYVDQLYEYKSKMVSSEDTTDLFDIFPPVNTDLPDVRDYLGEQLNDGTQLLDSTYTLSAGSKSVLTTPVQSQEINWNQYEEDVCQEDNTNIVCEQDGIASNTDASKWVRAGIERFPYSEPTFNMAKHMTDQNSGSQDFPPNSPYEYNPITNKDVSMGGRMPWSGKPWDSYPNAGIVGEELYQQSVFYQQNHFDQLLQGQVGFGTTAHQNDLGMQLCGNETRDGESSSLFTVNSLSSNVMKDTLTFAQRQFSNCEQDIHYLQSAASKVAPVHTANKKNGVASFTATSATKIRRRATNQTTLDDAAELNATPTTCAPIDTESDDNASYYMKPGNYLVPKKPMSARMRTEKRIITRNKRKAFSAPAKTSIFIPYPLDPVVPPLPQLPQSPAALFGDASLPLEPARLNASTNANAINDVEHFPSNCHKTFSPIVKSTKENKKAHSPVMSSNPKERKKKDTSRMQYPRAAPKEVRQFQILKRVSKVIGKVDLRTGNSENAAQISGVNSVNESKNGNSKITVSDSGITNNGSNVKEGMSHDVAETITSLQSLTINEGLAQQSNRKNAAMKSILNLRVKSKVSGKSTPKNEAQTTGSPVLCVLDRGDSCTRAVPSTETPNSSHGVTPDSMSEVSLAGPPSSCQVSTSGSRKSSLTPSDDGKTNKVTDISPPSKLLPSSSLNAKVEAFPKTPVATAAEPAGNAPATPRSEHHSTSIKNRNGVSSSSKSVYTPLKVHASTPNISYERGGGSKGRLYAAGDSSLRSSGGKNSPLSRQFSECREKLDRLSAAAQQRGGRGTATPHNAGSDDSSSTTASVSSSRHRRGPTPVALSKFEKILRNVWNMPEAQFIKHNVSSSELHEYYQIVKYPIFLENVETKLKNRYYMTIEDIVHDFRQVLFNSRLYFKDSPPELKKCDAIEGRLNELLNECFSSWDFRQITGDPAERLRNRR